MKNIYLIKGMSCNGCRNHVEQALKSVKGVASVSVNLEKAEATVESGNKVPFDRLEEALAGSHYEILQESTHPVKKN